MDIKAQFDRIVDQTGHKVIYRRYQTGVKSAYYDPVTHEGVGGERWKHTDTVIRVRDSQTSAAQQGTKGVYIGKSVYYLKAEYAPKVGDVIIEVNGSTDANVDDSVILSGEIRFAVRIMDISTKRDDSGRVVFHQCYVNPEYGYY